MRTHGAEPLYAAGFEKTGGEVGSEQGVAAGPSPVTGLHPGSDGRVPSTISSKSGVLRHSWLGS